MNYISFLSFLLSFAFANAQHTNFGSVYKFTETIFLDDSGVQNVGYRISGLLHLEYIGKDSLLAKIVSPQLHVLPKKLYKSQNQEFKPHTSLLDHSENYPFLIEFSEGIIQHLYISSNENSSMVALKKGVASILQFKKSKGTSEENDTSGLCKVKYNFDQLNTITKNKEDCSWPTKNKLNIGVWGSDLRSKRNTEIMYDKDKIVKSIIAIEEHELQSSLSNRMKLKISTKIDLTLSDPTVKKNEPDSNVVATLEKKLNINFNKVQLDVALDVEPWDTNNKKLKQVIADKTVTLVEENMGSSNSARSLLKGIEGAKQSNIEEIYEILTAKENENIITQILDILGAVQTEATHKAALKYLNMNSKKMNLDLCERYLWALSMSPNPKKYVIEDLFQLVKKEHENKKLWETLILTLPSMVHRYTFSKDVNDNELIQRTINFLLNKLKQCKQSDEDCHLIYLRGITNIPNSLSLKHLLQHLKSFKGRTSVEAIKSIKRLGPENWSSNVLNIAEEVFLANSTYDSTTRIEALDIILASKPDYLRLARTLSILKQSDSPRELKQYLLERLHEISERCSHFKKKVLRFLSEERLNNYNIFAQGGLSTAFSRAFMPEGSLSTTQEVFGGILKHGNVHINFLQNNTENSVFTLGLFSRGLTSFVSSEGESDENEVATAGFQLTLLDVNLRPFVFFNGNGELMGHVWSGTASTQTPAYQALLLLKDDHFSIPLGIGHEVIFKSAVAASVELSGQIEISLWNRNAQSLVQNRAGLVFQGGIYLNTQFLNTQMEFDFDIEPKLDLSTDINFYNTVALCLKLEQPDIFARYKSYKMERIIGSKHKISKTMQKTIPIPGKTYALNSKNNDMCNIISNEELSA